MTCAQMGKMSPGVYSLDFKWPVSCFQAFSVALAAFDVN